MASLHLFHGPRLKIERANHHIAELESLFNAFLGQGDTHAIVENDDGGAQTLTPVLKKSLPPHVATILGDAAHNLRAALDHLYINLTKINGQEPSKWTRFPIGPKNYVASQLTDTNPNPSLAVMDIIRNQIRPYGRPDGDGLISDLHELDIADKHVVLIPIAGDVRVSRMFVRAEDGSVAATFVDCSFGSVVQQVPPFGFVPPAVLIDGGYKAEQEEVPTLSIIFDVDQPLAGSDVIQTLKSMSQAVNDIVHTLADAA